MRVLIFGENGGGETALVDDKAIADLNASTVMFGARFAEIMGADDLVRLPALRGERPEGGPLFPGPGGFRLFVMTVPAGCSPLAPGAETDKELALIRAIDRATADKLAADPDGMANADTIEWVIILSGEIDYLLPDGTRYRLREKDSVVQVGSKHRWANDGDKDCVMAVAAVGAALRENDMP